MRQHDVAASIFTQRRHPGRCTQPRVDCARNPRIGLTKFVDAWCNATCHHMSCVVMEVYYPVNYCESGGWHCQVGRDLSAGRWVL